MNQSNCGVLILSCDKYADLWKPFFLFFDKYWKDCRFNVYLGTNRKSFEHKNVKQIFSNRETTWSDELEVILKQIPEEYIVIMLEDYFIYKNVDSEEIKSLIRIMEEKNSAFLRLGAFPLKYDALWPNEALPGHPKIGVIEKGAKYRLNLQTAIWKKDILLKLLSKDESPWEFEIEGSKRSDTFSNSFLCMIGEPSKNYVHGPITYYCTALSHGKWMRGALKLCRKENIPVDLTVRGIENKWESMARKIYISSPMGIRKLISFIKFRLSFKK